MYCWALLSSRVCSRKFVYSWFILSLRLACCCVWCLYCRILLLSWNYSQLTYWFSSSKWRWMSIGSLLLNLLNNTNCLPYWNLLTFNRSYWHFRLSPMSSRIILSNNRSWIPYWTLLKWVLLPWRKLWASSCFQLMYNRIYVPSWFSLTYLMWCGKLPRLNCLKHLPSLSNRKLLFCIFYSNYLWIRILLSGEWLKTILYSRRIRNSGRRRYLSRCLWSMPCWKSMQRIFNCNSWKLYSWLLMCCRIYFIHTVNSCWGRI